MPKSIVYMRSIQLDVVVPTGLEWDFMKAFGEAFRHNDAHEGTSFICPVDGYYEDPNGWHIQITVPEGDESRLLQFCNEFFDSREIPFRGPEVIEVSSITDVHALRLKPAHEVVIERIAEHCHNMKVIEGWIAKGGIMSSGMPVSTEELYQSKLHDVGGFTSQLKTLVGMIIPEGRLDWVIEQLRQVDFRHPAIENAIKILVARKGVAVEAGRGK